MSNEDNPFSSGNAGDDGGDGFDETNEMDPVPLDVGPILQRSFELFKDNAVVVILTLLIVGGLSIVIGLFDAGLQIAAENADAEMALMLSVGRMGVSIVNTVIMLFFNLGMVRIFLNITRGQEADLSMLFGVGRFMLVAIAAQILAGIAMFAGFLCFIIPGIILALGLQFYLYVIVDKNMGPIQALQESWRLTDGHKMTLFFIGLVIGLLGLVLLCCTFGLGYLAFLPILSLTQAVIYHSLVWRSSFEDDLLYG